MGKITDYTLLSSAQTTKVDDTGKPTSDDDEACFGITLDDVLKCGHLLIPAEELKYYELESSCTNLPPVVWLRSLPSPLP